jgi:hypothetical protein
MSGPDHLDDAGTQYVPPPDAHANSYDPQLEWLRRQLATMSQPARQPERRQPIEEYDDEVVEDEEYDDDENNDPVAARPYSRVATDTGLIPRAWIVFVMVWVVRIMMLGMLVASFVGSIASFNPNGIKPILEAFPWLRVASPWFVSGRNLPPKSSAYCSRFGSPVSSIGKRHHGSPYEISFEKGIGSTQHTWAWTSV